MFSSTVTPSNKILSFGFVNTFSQLFIIINTNFFISSKFPSIYVATFVKLKSLQYISQY